MVESCLLDRYYELDKTLSLQKNLQGKCIIEFPTLYIVSEEHAHSYTTLSAGKYMCSCKQATFLICICYQIFTSDLASQYLTALVQIHVPPRSLHSSTDDKTFCIPTFERKQHGG